MKYLKEYKIFENIQRGEKLLKDKNITNVSVYNILVDKMKEEGLSNYVGFVTEIILNEFSSNDLMKYFSKSHIPEIITNIKKIKDYKINVDNINLKYLSGLNAYLYDYKMDNDISKFITKYLPANLRKDISKENKSKLRDLITNINGLSDTDIELLKKGSRFKTVDEWVDYCKNVVFDPSRIDIDELLNSNIKIHEQDNEWLFYTPLDYKSYMIIKYKHWCTMKETFFNHYTKNGFVIALNKNDINKSLFAYKNGDKFDIFTYKNSIYYLSTYNNVPEDRDETIINKLIEMLK